MTEPPITDTHHNVLMPIPVTPRPESRLVIVTKFLSWLTATLLAAAVLVSLVAVTNERNDLQEQIENQSEELECRSRANVAVNEANANLNKVTAEQNRIIGEIVARQDDTELAVLNTQLNYANDAIIAAAQIADDAVTAQQESLTSCSKRD